MNAPIVSTSVALPKSPESFYQRTLLRGLGKFQRGCLSLHLPDGTEQVFGELDSGVEATIEVRDPDFFRRCILFGDIGLAEAYIDGLWETDSIERVIAWAITNVEEQPGHQHRQWRLLL
jgi:cyclopropane-fatty-acyl-phospholipid synthase